MRNTFFIQIQQASKHLIGEYLHLQSTYIPFILVFLDRLVQIIREVVHHHVQIFFICLVCEEGVSDLEYVGVVQAFQYLQLAVFIFLVLVHSFYSHQLESKFISGFVNHSECATPYLILEGISPRSNQLENFFSLLLILFGEGNGGVLSVLSKDFVDSVSLCVSECVMILDFGVEFVLGLWFGEDGLDGLWFLHAERLIIREVLFVLSQWYFRLIDIEANLFGIFVDFRFDPSTRCDVFLARGAHLQLYVAYHSQRYILQLQFQTSYITSFNLMQNTKEITLLSYLHCKKQDHADQVLNLVCLEKKCAQNLLCCCACIEADHKKHSVKPLKYVFNEVRQSPPSLKIPKLNSDILLELVNSNKNQSFKIYQTHKLLILASLENIESSLNSYYNSIIQQIICNNSDGSLQVEELIQKSMNATSVEELSKVIKKLVALLPSNIIDLTQITEKDVIFNIDSAQKQLQESIASALKNANTKVSEFQQQISSIMSNNNIWKYIRLAFMPQFIHPQLKLVNPNRIKSQKSNGYKFAILDPPIDNNSNKTISIKIIQSTNNWLSIGLCHKKIVLAKNLTFSIGPIGHGAYLIGSNGSSWSHNRVDLNNIVKGFKFVAGDIIKMHVNSQQKQITFKLGNNSLFQLPYENIPGDPLCVCALFYYKNDQIEYLPQNTS